MKNIIKRATVGLLAAAILCAPVAAATYQGVDIAHYDDVRDFNAIKASGHGQFVYIKTSEGTGYRDSKWQTFTAGAKSAGIPFGYYHYFHSGTNAHSAAQADVFWNLIKDTGYALVPAVDIEETDGNDAPVIQSSLRAFVNRFYALSGRKPMIYSYTSFFKKFIGDGFTDCPLWQAHVGVQSPSSIPGWGSDHTVWQYSWTGSVSGIYNSTDLDVADDRIFTGTPSAAAADQSASPYPYIRPVSRGTYSRRAVRTSASWSARVIGHISIGDNYEIMGPTNSKGWVQVGLCGHAIGYVSAYVF